MTPEHEMKPVRLLDPPKTNLLGLLLQGLLNQRLQSASLAKRARSLRGELSLAVGTMACTLDFSPEEIVIRNGVSARARATVRGPLSEFLPLVCRASRVAAVVAVLEQRISIRGNPLVLIRALPLLMSPKQSAHPTS